MGIVSYAQNFEDVILWRALGHLPHGCYIDVGAQHPIVDSISKAFYEHGWRGIHVEPTTEHANLLRADRPDETIVQAVVTDYPGVIRFYEIPGTGLSTARRDIAEEHQKKFGYPVVETLVTAVTLDDLLALAPGDDIHWLKIDVEGFEREVLSGWQKSARRPWIVVVEATYPTTQVDTFEQWEPLVLEKGYALVYQDGLNRYYLNDRRTELQPHFHFPPNVFDAFQLSGTASSLTRQLKDRLDHELAQMSAQKADVESQLHATRTALQSLEISAGGHERALTSLAERTLLEAQDKAQTHLLHLLERERAFAERQDALQREAGAREEQLRQGHLAQTDGLRAEQRAREAALQHDFEARLTELRQAAQAEQARLEQALDVLRGQHADAQAKAEARLQELLERERTFAEHLDAQQQEAVAREEQLRQGLLAQTEDLRCEQRKREEALQCGFDTKVMELRQGWKSEKTHLEHLVDALHAQIAVAESIRECLEIERAQYIEAAHQLAAEVKGIRQSWSWRITKPFRWLALREHTVLPALSPVDSLANQPPTAVLESVKEVDNSLTTHATADGQASASDFPTLTTTALNDRQSQETNMTLDELLLLPNESFLRSAYRAILGREPDELGLRHYLKRIVLGHSKASILYEIAQSHEAKTYACHGDLASLSDDVFIDVIYQRLLGRTPDTDGKKHYLDKLKGRRARQRVIQDINNSMEACIRRTHTAEFREDLDALLREERCARQWWGWWWRNQRIERRLNIFEGRIEWRLSLLEKQIEGTVSKLSNELAAHLHTRDCHADTSNISINTGRDQYPLVINELISDDKKCSHARIVYYFVDHTISCPVNTGMQRLVRQLGRNLIERGEVVRFVKWNAETKAFVLINRAELEHLANWNGPSLSGTELDLYPLQDEENNNIAPPLEYQEAWLMVPEVTHVTYQNHPPTMDAIMSARALGARVAFVYYDAIPLRLPEYSSGAAAHEKYMQALLLSDLLIPISRRSADELRNYFVKFQSAQSLPLIEPLHLPGESMLSPRVNVARHSMEENIILSVGSIEPRKNQLKLIEAFEQFSSTPDGQQWKLVLAGHLRGDVAPQVYAAIQRNGRINYVAHPTDEELDRIYRSAAFTVFPSFEEGFGLPILESLWYGIPCVCANFGAMAEVADGGGCMTIDVRDISEISRAITLLATKPPILEDLSSQALKRPMTTWADYADSIQSLLSNAVNLTKHVPTIYFWVDDTVRNPHNSGIQRVVRKLAKALLCQGYRLIPVKWNGAQLIPVLNDELVHLEKWNGPSPTQWGGWVEPKDCLLPKWLLIPELIHGHLPSVRQFAKSVGMRCAAVFYDAIPYKMASDFNQVFADNHAAYMTELANFDKVLSISRWSHNDLKEFLLQRRIRTGCFDHRFEVVSSLGPSNEYPRIKSIKADTSKVIQILSVISIEPRKNPIVLLDAFLKATTKSDLEIKLTIVGRKIPSFASLANVIENFQMNNPNFVWLQDIDDNHLTRLYAEADFTIFPSLEEGYGLPIVESLWNGRPCVIHGDGAMSEVGVGGGCISVNMRSSDELADAIASLVNSPSLRMSLMKAAVQRQIPTWVDYANDVALTLATDRLSDAIKPIYSNNDSDVDICQELVNLRKRPLLSVCISTYNRGPWLSVNLKNLFAQIPLPMSEVEFLVVDNASTDNTEDVVSEYIAREDFRFVRNVKNVGMLGNLTVTAQEACGDYVWILGDDDLLKDGAILRVLGVIKSHPGVSLIYPNYGYTHEKDPANVGNDIQKFLNSCPCLTPAGEDSYAMVKDISTKNENLFTAIYCLIFRRDHALRAYSQDTTGRPFSTMLTSIPTTYYVLNYMMDEPAYWMGDISLVVNFNVSWNKYASLQILERVPEAQDLAERLGASPTEMDRWRENLLPGFVHYWTEMYENDQHGNAEYFSAERVVMRMKHLEKFASIVPALAEIYDRAHKNGHRAAIMPTNKLFSAFF